MVRRRKVVKKNETRQQQALLIFVEGETEENYIKYLKSIYNKNLNVDIKKKSKISNVADFAREVSIKYSLSEGELVLVYDLEGSETEYKKFVSNNKMIHPTTYLTQPCIEAHFLLHHPESNKYQHNANLNAKEVETELLKLLKNYKKGSSFCWKKNGITENHIGLSIKQSIKKFNELDDTFFSMIGYLVKNHIASKESYNDLE